MQKNWYEDFTLWWSYARIPLFTFVAASFGMTWFVLLRFGRSHETGTPTSNEVSFFLFGNINFFILCMFIAWKICFEKYMTLRYFLVFTSSISKITHYSQIIIAKF